MTGERDASVLKSTVFVGSSAEHVPIVQELIRRLHHEAKVVPWYDIELPGQSFHATLIATAALADVAVFVFTKDDVVLSRDAELSSPRDNVVYEAGLFAGILGADRTVVVKEEGVKTPSDLDGLVTISYDFDTPAAAAAKVSRIVRDQGLRRPLLGNWWQHPVNTSGDVERGNVSFVSITSPGGAISIKGAAWTKSGEPLANFASTMGALVHDCSSVLYRWAGRWPRVERAPSFRGLGQISIDPMDTAMATGWFTTTADAYPEETSRTLCHYQRATQSEESVMIGARGGAERAETRQGLIAQRLGRIPDIMLPQSFD